MRVNYIIDYLKKHNYDYIPIEDEKSIEPIYNLFKDGKVSESLEEIVLLYHGIYFHIKSEYDKSFKYYEQAAKMGNSHAMNNLGDCYYCGCYVELNYEQAVKLYRQSAELGNSRAMNNLGDYYYFGWAIELNYELAIEWYKKSAELGNSYAGYLLGNYYYEQKTKDTMQVAISYYKKASDLGNAKAKAKLREITKDNLLITSYLDMVKRVKELEDLNSHLMLYPGSDYREALKDFNYMQSNDSIE